jgi:tetratricopeptide (TPR) repeat protein
MITKRIISLVTFFSLITVSVSFAADIISKNQQELLNNNEDSGVVLSAEAVAKKNAKMMIKARKSYIDGNFDEAEKYVDEILEISPNDTKAGELKNKILMLNEKIIVFKKAIVNDYLIELRRTVKEGNYYEGFLFNDKISKLIPNSKDSLAFARLSIECNIVMSSLEDVQDRKKFIESIDYFKKEKFKKASNLICELAQKYPKFQVFVGMGRYYALQETSNKRVNMYYKEAMKNMKKGRFGKAKDYVELGFSLQPDNIRLITLMEQINMELM